MWTRLSSRTLLVASLLYWLPSGPVRADILTATQSESIPLSLTFLGPGSSTSEDPLVFTKFDPTLGALQEVILTMNYKFTQDFRATFTTPSTISISSVNNQVSLTRPDMSELLGANPPDATVTLTYGFQPGEALPHIQNFPTQVTTGSLGPLSLTDPADLALFTAAPGVDSISLPVFGRSRMLGTIGTANGEAGGVTRVGVDVQLTYRYAAVVAEPASLTLLSLGGLLLARRLRPLQRSALA